MSVKRYTRFKAATVSWLRTNAALVTATEHTGSDRRIFGMVGEDTLKIPMCGIVLGSSVNFGDTGADAALFDTIVLLLLRHTSESALYDMAGIIEDHSANAQGGNAKDVEFSGTNLVTKTIMFLGPSGNFGEVAGESKSGKLEINLSLRIIWRET